MSTDAEDYSKMKVIELKKLLKEKGLPLGGTKDELIERLKSANEAEKLLDETPGNAAVDEDLEREIMAEGEKVSSSSGQAKGKKGVPEKRKMENGKEPKAAAKAKEAPKAADDKAPKKIKLSTDGTEKPDEGESKLEARAKKFGISNSNEETKKEIRAKRFSADTPSTPTEEALKKRAERFGITTATPEISGLDEKKKKRAERFGMGTGAASETTPKKAYAPIIIEGNKKVSMASPILAQSAQERKALRANRFMS